MKKVRFLALTALLVALAANGMVTYGHTRALCYEVDPPNSLCYGSIDTGCNDFCTFYDPCYDFENVHGGCTPSGACICRGTPLP